MHDPVSELPGMRLPGTRVNRDYEGGPGSTNRSRGSNGSALMFGLPWESDHSFLGRS
jgi:hypothetical protein